MNDSQINGAEFRKYATKHLGIPSARLDQYQAHVENMTSHIIEEREMRFAAIDVFTRLIMDRIIFLGLPIDSQVGNVVVGQLLFLESADSSKDITMYINSPGGSVIDGMGIYDTMQMVKPDVATICTSLAASMGAVLVSSGAKGKRSALPHSRIMIHQPSGGMQGQFSDMEINYQLIKTLRKELYDILAENAGKTFEDIERDSDRDNWMTAQQAKEYGLLDEVLLKR